MKKMKGYTSKISNDYFTEGKTYYVFDYIADGGIMTYDNNNKTHYISGDYLNNNFTQVK